MISTYEVEGLKVYRYVFQLLSSNMYMMLRGTEAILIDPFICKEAEDMIRMSGVKKVWIILTHEHFDHILGVNYYREHWACTVIGHKNAMSRVCNPEKNLASYVQCLVPEEVLSSYSTICFDDIINYSCQIDVGFEREYNLNALGVDFDLIETPGHSPGSICILIGESYVFTGDSLIRGEKVITRLPGGNKKDYQNITKPFLEGLSKSIIVFPGHGNEGNMKQFLIA